MDGKADTFWKATPYYQWWLMDCGSTHLIESITVDTGMQEGEFCRYAIDYSIDRINWTELYEKNDDRESTGAGDCYSAHFSARYIRITLTYCSSGDTVSLRNVTVVGEPCDNLGTAGGCLVQSRVRADACDACEGFKSEETDELEPGWRDNMMICLGGGSWLVFRGVELGQLREHQLCGMFYFREKDKTLHVCVEVRLDSKGGPLIGSMNVTRQYTPWLQLACDLVSGNYGARNVYLCIPQIDAPQRLGILWLNIKKRPELCAGIIDHADEPVLTGGPNRVYFGNLHSHTGFTDGSRTPAYAYDYARYVAKLDFLGVTEHSNLFEPYDPELDQVIYTIELNSVEVSEENSLMYYIHALDQGWHISPVGSQDNHRENWGTENDIRTGAILRQLTKAGFYDAVRKHRTYYTSAKSLAVIFYANGLLMGSTLPPADEVSFDISIRNEKADSELDYVEIIGACGRVLCMRELSGHDADMHISVDQPSSRMA